MSRPIIQPRTAFAPRGVSRRRFLGTTAAAASALALGTRPGLAQSSELEVWLPGGSDLFCDIHTNLLEGFASRTAGLTGSKIQCGLGQDMEFLQVLVGSIMGSAPPAISMLWDSPASLATQGAFMPLDDMLAASTIPLSTWPAGLMSSCQFRGQTFGLPVTAGVYAMWYNQDLFDAKGIPSDRASFPKTWAEMRALSKEFTVWNGDRLETAGFMPSRSQYTFDIWAALNGGRVFDGDNLRYEINSEQNVEMMNFFLDWLDEEYRGDVTLIDASGNFEDGYPDPDLGLAPAFREGRLAGMQSGSWLMGDIWADPEPTFSNWNLAPHPVGPSGTTAVSGTWPNWFVIPVGSPNPQAAFDYLAYLSVEGVVEWYRQIPDVPTNAQVTPVNPQVVVDRRGEDFADDITAFLQQQAAVTTAMWHSPVNSFGQDQISRALEKIFTKTAGIADALNDAQAASQAELERVLAG